VRTEEGPRLVMIDGMAQTLERASRRLFTTRFADFTYDISALIDAPFRDGQDMRALPTGRLLRADAATQAATGRPRAALLTEAHGRIAQPFLAPAVALIGFGALMLGAFSRFGVSRQIVGAIVLLILVQLIDNAAEDAARGDVRLVPLVYAAPLAGIVLGTGLLWLSGRARRRPAAARGAAPPAAAGAGA